MQTWKLDEQGSIAWIAHPDERTQRASVALAVEGGCLLFDAVDAEGLDDTLAGIGQVLGVCQLLDRHGRDGAALAARHGAARLTPSELRRSTAYPEIETREIYRARRWRETAVWLPARRLLIVPEAVGHRHGLSRASRRSARRAPGRAFQATARGARGSRPRHDRGRTRSAGDRRSRARSAPGARSARAATSRAPS